MTTTLNASTAGAGGFIATGDNSGSLALQTGGTTAVTIDSSQNATFAGKVTSAGALTLASNGTTTAVTIDTSQNVGIGTSSPSNKLHVATSSGNAYMQVGRATQGQGQVGVVIGGGTSGTDWLIYQDTSANNLQFYGNGSERMRIDSSGRLLVGCTTEPNSSVNGFKADVSYTIIASSGQTPFYVNRNTNTGTIIELRYNNSSVGTISTNGSNTAYNTSSDYRLKENISPMTGALATVAQLKPVTYKWKFTGKESQGFIAHEIAEVVPDCVTGEKDAVDADGKPVYQGIDVSFLVATLTAAIQEQQALINALTARVVALESK